MTACCSSRPTAAYGRPDDLKALIDAAHQRGLMVFLDVVYNHFGPEGNYLGRYRAAVFQRGADALGRRDRLSRAGGARGSRSRTRCIGCATIRFDGLRLDAVHAIVEPGRTRYPAPS